MPGKSNAMETDVLNLIFKNSAPASAWAAAGTLGSLYVSLHTGDPGEAGTQSTSEIAYGGYARVAVTRGAGWNVSGNTANPAAAIQFAEATSGSGTVTHFAVGTAVSGAGQICYFGTVSPNITVGAGITPQLTTATSITED